MGLAAIQEGQYTLYKSTAMPYSMRTFSSSSGGGREEGGGGRESGGVSIPDEAPGPLTDIRGFNGDGAAAKIG